MPRTATSAVAAKVVGRNIRDARKQAGLTQAQVAARMTVNPSYVANLEAGRVNATVGQLAHVAEALGAGLDIAFPLLDIERITAAVPKSRLVKAAVRWAAADALVTSLARAAEWWQSIVARRGNRVVPRFRGSDPTRSRFSRAAAVASVRTGPGLAADCCFAWEAAAGEGRAGCCCRVKTCARRAARRVPSRVPERLRRALDALRARCWEERGPASPAATRRGRRAASRPRVR